MPNIKENPMLLTVSQAAELLQLGRDTVYQLTHREDFPAIRLGRNVRINRAALQAWLDKNNGGMLL
ncbi:DNA-binding protein [Pseudoflavonifractor sp. 60]|uniref:helix-turn-helix domain-containing protein n=1 Tax=Pseudoflavonifractor sp. 60 TaxID=2304576 RepID=UPI001369BBBA|nr:helix-turn-helix domain-containing protein [Pseudoflavonifractor sp. 60]NBI66088.1 DNA-binding protein [Pseudoflavonifractor sp. 60]